MTAQVIARYLFGRPIAWGEELARLALIWLAFIAAAFVMADGRHITVDVVSRRLSRGVRLALECVAGAVVLAACAVITAAGVQFSAAMAHVNSPALEIPMSWWYLSAAMGFALIGIHAALNLAMTLSGGASGRDHRAGSAGDAGPGVLT
jgi:TRAP-type C4-dicarboxylate transport system permease small subunit